MDHLDKTGSEIGNYRLMTKINSGSFGTVFKAEHKFIQGHIVAIKLLHQNIASNKEREQFIQEAQFLALLEHPHILSLLDFGFLDHQPYLIARYAAGGSLRDLLQQSPQLSPDRIMDILTKVGLALHFAHQRQIIHRDLKPENILFTAQGEPLLADFGIATMLSTASGEHLTTVSGTPSYMAPEQFRGLVSKESDQYALGCIAYELVTGRRPFTAPDFIALGFKHTNERPVPPSHYTPLLATPTEAAILKAMAKNRSERYADIPAFLADFCALSTPTFVKSRSPLQQLSHPVQPLPSVPSVPSLTGRQAFSVEDASGILQQTSAQAVGDEPPPAKRTASITTSNQHTSPSTVAHRAVASRRWLVLTVLALLILVGSALSYFAFLAPGRHQQINQPAIVPDAALQATTSARATAQSRLTATVQAAATSRAWVIATAQAQGQPQLLWSFATGAPIYSSATVVDGTIFIGSNNGNLYAINSLTDRQIWAFATGGIIHYRPNVVNGVVYIGSANGQITAIDAATGKLKWSFTTGSGVTGTPAVANGIAYDCSGDGKLYAINATTGRQIWTFATGSAIWSSPVIASGTVYVTSTDNRVYSIDAGNGQQKWAFVAKALLPVAPTIDNGIVYVGGNDHTLYALNATTGQEIWSFLAGNVIWSTPTVVNGIVYFGSHDQKLYAVNATTGQLKWAFPTGGKVWSSPTVVNGIVYVGSMDHKLYAINAITGQQKWTFATGDAIQYSSPTIVDGVVYIGSKDDKLYAIATGE